MWQWVCLRVSWLIIGRQWEWIIRGIARVISHRVRCQRHTVSGNRRGRETEGFNSASLKFLTINTHIPTKCIKRSVNSLPRTIYLLNTHTGCLKTKLSQKCFTPQIRYNDKLGKKIVSLGTSQLFNGLLQKDLIILTLKFSTNASVSVFCVWQQLEQGIQHSSTLSLLSVLKKGQMIPLQARCGPEGG